MMGVLAVAVGRSPVPALQGDSMIQGISLGTSKEGVLSKTAIPITLVRSYLIGFRFLDGSSVCFYLSFCCS
jgi:hypothetical protein